MLTTSIDRVQVTVALDPYLSLLAAASYCGLSTRFLRGRIAEGQLPHYRPGGKVLVRRSHLDAWLEQFKRVGTQDLDSVVDGILRDFQAAPKSQSGSHRAQHADTKGQVPMRPEQGAAGV